MNWVYSQLPMDARIQDFANQLTKSQPTFPLPLANILIQRGIDDYEKAKSFFTIGKQELHDPFLMKDMEEAVNRILQAKEKGEKVLIYGDYDVDGTTSVTLMSLFCEDWQITYDYYVPDRYTEGYGISFKGVEYAKNIGASLIIALDCGIKANDKVKYAQQLGIDFIICDHHTPGKELPAAIAVLDPLREDCPYPFKELSGCGIGLKLATALMIRAKERGIALPYPEYDVVDKFCDLAALSIACDIVPIRGENRAIAFLGLQKIQSEKVSPGIKSIMALSNMERKWDVNDMVFFVGPRINSAGRLTNARHAVEVLMGKGVDTLKQLADDLHTVNDQRRDIDALMTQEALEMIANDQEYTNTASTVLYKPEWNKGVIGIVASRLIEKHYRPTILFTQSEDKLVGSARSVAGFDLYAVLEQCADYMIQFGGHKYAAGMTIKAEDYVVFRKTFDQKVAERILPEQKKPILRIDHGLAFGEINERFIRILQRMEPFGPENLEPVFATKNVEVTDMQVLKDTHIRFVFKQGGITFAAIGFGLAEKYKALDAKYLDIAYHLSIKKFQDKTFIQLILKDFQNITK